MKLLVIATFLIMPGSAPVAPAQQAVPARTIMPPSPPRQDMPNAFSTGGPNCASIRRQVEARRERLRPRDDARTLDREPMAFTFLAVDRSVDGCREVTFLNGRPRLDEPGR